MTQVDVNSFGTCVTQICVTQQGLFGTRLASFNVVILGPFRWSGIKFITSLDTCSKEEKTCYKMSGRGFLELENGAIYSRIYVKLSACKFKKGVSSQAGIVDFSGA